MFAYIHLGTRVLHLVIYALARTAKTHVLYVNDFSKPLHEHWHTLPKGPTHPGLGSQNHLGDWLNRRDPDTTMLDAFERVPCDPRA